MDEVLREDIARHLSLIWKNMWPTNVELQLSKINQDPWNICQPESQIQQYCGLTKPHDV